MYATLFALMIVSYLGIQLLKEAIIMAMLDTLKEYVEQRCTPEEIDEQEERFLWAIQEWDSHKGWFGPADVAYLKAFGLHPSQFQDEGETEPNCD